MRETYVTVLGNVVDTPRVVVTNNGTVLTKFRLASAPSTRREDGQWERGNASFYEVTCFKKLGANVAGSVAPGDGVIVLGKLEVREWEANDRYGKEVAITANCVGLDMTFGTTVLRRPDRTAPPQAADEFGEAEEATEAA